MTCKKVRGKEKHTNNRQKQFDIRVRNKKRSNTKQTARQQRHYELVKEKKKEERDYMDMKVERRGRE